MTNNNNYEMERDMERYFETRDLHRSEEAAGVNWCFYKSRSKDQDLCVRWLEPDSAGRDLLKQGRRSEDAV